MRDTLLNVTVALTFLAFIGAAFWTGGEYIKLKQGQALADATDTLISSAYPQCGTPEAAKSVSALCWKLRP